VRKAALVAPFVAVALIVAGHGATCGEPVVEAPAFAPAPGIYAPPLTVTLSSTEPDGKIRYTIDGDPTATSRLYTHPIHVRHAPRSRRGLAGRAPSARWRRAPMPRLLP
jgi:hypothetical protein